MQTNTKLPKKLITTHLLPHLSESTSGRPPKIPLWRIINIIIYRLKTGCQWRELPIAFFCRDIVIAWQTAYYHFNKWSKDGSWKRLWTAFLRIHKAQLDMSSVQLDGSHTPAKRGGEAVAYQGRKKAKTCNALFLCDKQGIPLAISTAIGGNHNDLFEIQILLDKMFTDLAKSSIDFHGLFLNADAGFDGAKLYRFCEKKEINPNIMKNKRNSKRVDNEHFVDEKLYQERFVVERTNAWIDAFKALLVRFETKANNWISLHYLAFTLILARRTF